MDYSSHTYPRELAEKIISEWPEVTNPLDDLPPKEALISLLSEAFQALLSGCHELKDGLDPYR